ncbi:hypothetical protein [Maritalea sp.]|uniref:hypothetical protein n=1 Tax=Maritalea sp. TaxID=2003361 RepID=UPI003EF694DA
MGNTPSVSKSNIEAAVETAIKSAKQYDVAISQVIIRPKEVRILFGTAPVDVLSDIGHTANEWDEVLINGQKTPTN